MYHPMKLQIVELHLRLADDIAIIWETQWRHSVKTRLYYTPSPIFHSVKRSDVTPWKRGYILTLPTLPKNPYFIVLASSVKAKEV